MSAIALEALTCRYGKSVAVDGIDLSVRDGEFLSLLGPSGCGKTTTLRCIAGLEQPDEGRISIGGQLVADGNGNYSIPPNKRALGMVFQSYALWPHMSVYGNVAYPLKMRRTSKAETVDKVRKALTLVGMAEFGQRATSELSGGQQQRVALARALASEPRVLLLDEPLSNLDSALRTHMRRELRRIHREIRTTCVYVTHDQLEAATLSDRIVVMRAGRIQQIGTPQAIFETPVNTWVAEFVGYDNFIAAQVLGHEQQMLRVQPLGWPQTLICRQPAGPTLAVGSRVDLALRSSSLGMQRNQPGAIAITAQVSDTMFIGDLTEFVLDAYGTRLIARIPERSSSHDGTPAQRGQIELFVHPDHIVALPTVG